MKILSKLRDWWQAPGLKKALATERLLRQKTERVEAELRRMDRMKDEFLATLSHELRTPLTSIVGYVDLLRYTPPDAIEFMQALDAVERNAQSQLHLVNDLLDVSRITQGNLPLERQPVDLIGLVNEVVEGLRFSAEARHVTLPRVAPSQAGRMVGDPARLRQVAWNLLSNAIKFTPKFGSVKIEVQRVKSWVHLSVEDSGRGIDPAFLPYVFERFRQEDSGYSRRYGGLGLGLAITRHIVELHGGTVSAQSQGVGRGATFVAKLPILAILTDAKERAERAASSVQPLRRLERLKVLVVDDNLDTLEVLTETLTLEGAEVTTAASVAAAMRAIEANPPALIISDIGMPDEDGLALIRKVKSFERERGLAIPAIAFTAHVREEERDRVLGAGFDAHIGKPIRREQLIELVCQAAEAGRGEL